MYKRQVITGHSTGGYIAKKVADKVGRHVLGLGRKVGVDHLVLMGTRGSYRDPSQYSDRLANLFEKGPDLILEKLAKSYSAARNGDKWAASLGKKAYSLVPDEHKAIYRDYLKGEFDGIKSARQTARGNALRIGIEDALRSATIAGLPDAEVPPPPIVGKVTNVTSKTDEEHFHEIGGGRDFKVGTPFIDAHIWYPHRSDVREKILDLSSQPGARW